MPFIPAIVEAVVAVGEAVAGAAEAASTVAATAAEVGGEAASTGAEVGAEAGEVGGEVGGETGEVGGEASSTARSVGDVAKQVYKGADKANKINDDVNKITGNNNNNNNQGNVGPLSGAIDSMSGGSSVGSAMMPTVYQHNESEKESPSIREEHHDHAPTLGTEKTGIGLEENSDDLANIGPARSSGNMRI